MMKIIVTATQTGMTNHHRLPFLKAENPKTAEKRPNNHPKGKCRWQKGSTKNPISSRTLVPPNFVEIVTLAILSRLQ
jgi:hypothetical protein